MIAQSDDTPTITCSACHARLPVTLINQGQVQPCPSCGRKVQVLVFPALFRQQDSMGESNVIGGTNEPTCYHHNTRRAVRACNHCGRFICALCDISLGEQHLCPRCTESGNQKGEIQHLDLHRNLYPDLAGIFIAVGLIAGPFLPLFGLIGVGIALWAWNKPRSLVRPGNSPFVLAIVCGSLEVILSGVIWFHMFGS